MRGLEFLHGLCKPRHYFHSITQHTIVGGGEERSLGIFIDNHDRLAAIHACQVLYRARDTNRNRSTVWRALRRLERLKLLHIPHARSRRKPNRYRPTLGEIHAQPQTLKRKTSPRGLMLRTRNVNAANSQHHMLRTRNTNL